jgi:toxin HigB-1
MIKSFGNKVAHELADGRVSSKHARKIPRNHVQRDMDLLQFMEGSIDVSDFKRPLSNRLHKLEGDLQDYWSLTIRDGWRIIFRFENGYYWDVKILDYH